MECHKGFDHCSYSQWLVAGGLVECILVEILFIRDATWMVNH